MCHSETEAARERTEEKIRYAVQWLRSRWIQRKHKRSISRRCALRSYGKFEYVGCRRRNEACGKDGISTTHPVHEQISSALLLHFFTSGELQKYVNSSGLCLLPVHSYDCLTYRRPKHISFSYSDTGLTFTHIARMRTNERSEGKLCVCRLSAARPTTCHSILCVAASEVPLIAPQATR